MNPILANAEGANFRVPSWRSKDYLAHVRRFPCCRCGKAGPSDAHHVIPARGASMGSKVDDFRTIPLCRSCHDLWHAAAWGHDNADRIWTYQQQLRMVHAWLIEGAT